MKDYSKYNLYSILNIMESASFEEIKKAYYKAAKTCHPDLHSGSPQKEEEFKQIVLAFDILSDPDKRKIYDLQRAKEKKDAILPGFEPSVSSIMDSEADDTLEELIVGNEVPEYTTLATLFLDLERTEVFMTFREGKYLYRNKKYKSAIDCFLKIVNIAPTNILYRCFLARTYASLRKFSPASKQYSEAIKIGENRIPPQKLEKIRKELEFVRKKQNPLIGGIFSIFSNGNKDRVFFDSQSDMLDEMNRAINHLNAEIEQKKLQEEKEKHILK